MSNSLQDQCLSCDTGLVQINLTINWELSRIVGGFLISLIYKAFTYYIFKEYFGRLEANERGLRKMESSAAEQQSIRRFS